VQLLLAKDGIDVDSKDIFGRTAMSWAARNGHKKVVELFLMRDDVDMNSQDSDLRGEREQFKRQRIL
jgi:ankyrin repeat protein